MCLETEHSVAATQEADFTVEPRQLHNVMLYDQ